VSGHYTAKNPAVSGIFKLSDVLRDNGASAARVF